MQNNQLGQTAVHYAAIKNHLDCLEIQVANKHQWNARQFYYALQHTLTGQALKTLTCLEDETECPDLSSLLPDWFETEMQELRQMFVGKLGFP